MFQMLKLKLIHYLLLWDGLGGPFVKCDFRVNSNLGKTSYERMAELNQGVQLSDTSVGTNPNTTSNVTSEQIEITPGIPMNYTNDTTITTTTEISTGLNETQNVWSGNTMTNRVEKRVFTDESDLSAMFNPMKRSHEPKLNKTTNTTIVDVFENIDYLLETAAHGLHFQESGEAYIFFDSFDHFVKMDLPDKIQFKEFNISDCTQIWKGLGNVQTFPGLVNRTCVSYSNSYNKEIEELRIIMNSRYASFEQRISRKKRFISVPAGFVGGLAGGAISGAIVGGIVGGAAGYYAAKTVVSEVENKLSKLEEKTEKLMEATRIQMNSLIGLTTTTMQIAKDADEKVKLLTKKTNEQIEHIEEVIRALHQDSEAHEFENNIRMLFSQQINAELNTLQNIMNLELDKMNSFEKIITELSTGKLSRDLIGPNKLREILKDIQTQLLGVYEIMIPLEELVQYYSLPICSYAIMKKEESYKLYVYMKISLKPIRTLNQFRIITAKSTAFPCFSDNCVLQFKTEGDYMQKFELEQTSYLISTLTGNIIYEANLDSFDCQMSVQGRTCFTFFPTLLQEPSACSKSIHEWKMNEIAKWCRFRSAQRDEYRVITVRRNMYVAHENAVKQYNEICLGETRATTKIISWAEAFEIPENCEVYIPTTGQRLFGPFSKNYTSITSLDSYSVRSELIEKIANKYYNVSMAMRIGEIARSSRLTNITNFTENVKIREEIDYILNNMQLTKVTKHLSDMQVELQSALDNLDQSVHKISYTSTFWGYFSLAGDCIQMLTTLTVIFGLLSYTNIFGLLGAHVIILEARPVNGFQIIPDIHLLPQITVDVMNDTIATQFFMNIAFVFLFTVLLFLFIYYGTFRKIVFSYHYGRGLPNECKGRLSLSYSSDTEFESQL